MEAAGRRRHSHHTGIRSPQYPDSDYESRRSKTIAFRPNSKNEAELHFAHP